jgi:hypothetical protein
MLLEKLRKIDKRILLLVMGVVLIIIIAVIFLANRPVRYNVNNLETVSTNNGRVSILADRTWVRRDDYKVAFFKGMPSFDTIDDTAEAVAFIDYSNRSKNGDSDAANAIVFIATELGTGEVLGDEAYNAFVDSTKNQISSLTQLYLNGDFCKGDFETLLGQLSSADTRSAEGTTAAEMNGLRGFTHTLTCDSAHSGGKVTGWTGMFFGKDNANYLYIVVGRESIMNANKAYFNKILSSFVIGS